MNYATINSICNARKRRGLLFLRVLERNLTYYVILCLAISYAVAVFYSSTLKKNYLVARVS